MYSKIVSGVWKEENKQKEAVIGILDKLLTNILRDRWTLNQSWRKSYNLPSFKILWKILI